MNATVYANPKKPRSVYRVFRVLYDDLYDENSNITNELAFAKYMNEQGKAFCRATPNVVGLTRLLSARVYQEPIKRVPEPLLTTLRNYKQPEPSWLRDANNPMARDWTDEWIKTSKSPYIAVFEYERCERTFQYVIYNEPEQLKGNKLILLYHAIMMRWNELIKDDWYLIDFHSNNLMNCGPHWYLIDYGNIVKVKVQGNKQNKFIMQLMAVQLFSPIMPISQLISDRDQLIRTRKFSDMIAYIKTWPQYATEIEPTIKRLTARCKAAKLPSYEQHILKCIDIIAWAVDPKALAKYASIKYRGMNTELGVDLRYANNGFKMPTVDQLKHAFTLIDLSAKPTLNKLLAYHGTLCC